MPRLRSQLAALCFCALPLGSCALLYAAPIPGPSRHLAKKDARDQIADLEQQWRAATMAGDIPALDKLLADDYVGISWTGQVNTKMSQLDRLRNKSLVITKMDVTDVKVKVVGPVAIVTSRSDIQGSNDGVELKGAFVYTRIYQRSPAGQWKITNFEATRVPPGGRPNRRGGPPPPPEEHP
jgi:ketosteroid isomerase-like protein